MGAFPSYKQRSGFKKKSIKKKLQDIFEMGQAKKIGGKGASVEMIKL